MQDLPHHYVVSARAAGKENVVVSSDNLPDIETAGPPEFGGPEGNWSPETLLVAAIADCFILSFRAITRAARYEWLSLACHVDGTLDKIDKVTQFTAFAVRAELVVPPGSDEAKGHSLLEKAEKHCLISNSLKAPSHLDATVRSS